MSGGRAPGARVPLLAIETSTRVGSVALLRDHDVGHEIRLDADAAHSRDLLGAIDRLVRQSGLSPGDLAAIAVGTGPGSYTGLRVGVCAARSLHYALGAELLGLCSFEALCFERLSPTQRALVAIDARGGQFYAARYARTQRGVSCLLDPSALEAGAFAKLCEQSRAGGELLLGDPPSRRAAGLDDGADAPGQAAVPSALALARLAVGLDAAQRQRAQREVDPLYLRPFATQPRSPSKES